MSLAHWNTFPLTCCAWFVCPSWVCSTDAIWDAVVRILGGTGTSPSSKMLLRCLGTNRLLGKRRRDLTVIPVPGINSTQGNLRMLMGRNICTKVCFVSSF